MREPTHCMTSEACHRNCEDALAHRIYDLVAEAKEEGFSVSEAVLAIVKVAHTVYMREGSTTSMRTKSLTRKNPGTSCN